MVREQDPLKSSKTTCLCSCDKSNHSYVSDAEQSICAALLSTLGFGPTRARPVSVEKNRGVLARFLAVLARLLSILENSVKDGRADPATCNGGDDRTSCAGEGESATTTEATTVQSRRGTREVSWLG